MKRILPLMLIALLTNLPVWGQGIARNVTVIESSTGTWCFFCPGSSLATKDMDNNADKVAILKYHGGDAYENPSSLGRINYYGITSYPNGRVDGVTTIAGGSNTSSIYSSYQPAINNALGLNTPIEIEMEVIPVSNQYYGVEVRLKKLVSGQTDNLKLHFAITESHIPAQWFSLNEVSYTVREMLPDHLGTSVDLSAVGATDTISFNVVLDPSWDHQNVEFVAFVQDEFGKRIFNGAKAPTYAATAGVDVGFKKNLVELPSSYCDDVYEPEFLVINNGSAPLSNFQFEYQINGGPIQTHLWSGNLKFYETARISLPAAAYTSAENNNLEINIVNPNGLTDMDSTNNQLLEDWSGNFSTFGSHTLLIKTDLNGSQNNWLIKSQQFGILAGGGPYTDGDNNIIAVPIDLQALGNEAFNCYSFEIYDTQGNGMPGGYFYLINAYGDTIVSNATGAFDNKYEEDFTLTWATDIEKSLAANFAQVFPNPSSGLFAIRFAERPQQSVDWKVYNLNGSLIAQGSEQSQAFEIDLNDQAGGIYQIVLRSNDKMWSKKLIKY